MDQEAENTSTRHFNQSTTDPGDDVMTVERYIWVYTLPIIFIIGVCGNILTILVMRRRRMRGTATSIYLTLMAAADMSVLITGIIPEWLIQTRIKDLAEIHQWVCKFERFLFYGTGDIAIWIMVAFTCDRFIAVCFPFKKRQYCTPKRAKLACLIVFLAAIVKNAHVFWTRGNEYSDDGDLIEKCGKPEPFTYFEKKVRPWIVMALVSLGPFLIILVCNVMIIKQLFFSTRLRVSTSSDNTKAFTQTTAMCLSTSFAFLIFITPSIVLLIGKPYWKKPDEPNVAYGIAKAVNNQLMFFNHSINFFLYCLTGGRFRDEFIAMFQCRKSSDKHNGRKAEYSLTSSGPTKSSSFMPTTPQFVGLRKSRSKKLADADTSPESSSPLASNVEDEKESLSTKESTT